MALKVCSLGVLAYKSGQANLIIEDTSSHGNLNPPRRKLTKSPTGSSSSEKTAGKGIRRKGGERLVISAPIPLVSKQDVQGMFTQYPPQV